MRTLKKWEGIKNNYLEKFPPRIARDLTKIDTPKFDKIESVFIHGDVHTGKTIRASQMLMEELKYIYLNNIEGVHSKVLFVAFTDFLAELKSTFNNQEKLTEEVLRKYLDAHLLVFDDFLTTRPTDWVLDVIYYLINYRYEQESKTIITSNFNLEEIESILKDQRIPSRISRMCKIEHKQSFN